MKLFKLNSVAFALGFSALSNIAVAEITTPKAVVGSNGAEERLIASAKFATPVSGDLYVAVAVGGKLIFLADNGNKVTESVSPFAENQQYFGTISLLDLSTAGIAPGQYQMYQLVAQSGTNPLDVTNWVGGLSGLSSINLMVNLPDNVTGDFDHDGFPDNDLNRDGFDDRDANRNGVVEVEESGQGDNGSDDNGSNDNGSNDNGSDDNGSNDNSSNDNNMPVTGASTSTGKTLYSTHCTGCHGIDPTRGKNGIDEATNPRDTREAINRNKGGMGYLNFLTDADLQAIATYVRNPN